MYLVVDYDVDQLVFTTDCNLWDSWDFENANCMMARQEEILWRARLEPDSRTVLGGWQGLESWYFAAGAVAGLEAKKESRPSLLNPGKRLTIKEHRTKEYSSP